MIWKKRYYRTYSGKRNKLWLKILIAVLAVCVVGFGVLEGIVLSGGRTEIKKTPGVMVILGAQVKPWGPSEMLKDRLDTALDYLKDNPDLPVVVSGGQGRDEPVSEAQCMRDYLVEHGISEERIWLEDQSHNTNQNIRFSKALLEARGLEDAHVLVVSNGFHLARARMLAGRQGLDTSTLAAPSSHLPSRLKMYVREPLALVKSFLFDR